MKGCLARLEARTHDRLNTRWMHIRLSYCACSKDCFDYSFHLGTSQVKHSESTHTKQRSGQHDRHLTGHYQHHHYHYRTHHRHNFHHLKIFIFPDNSMVQIRSVFGDN